MADLIISTYTAEICDGELTFVFQAMLSGTMQIKMTIRSTGQTFDISQYDWEKMMISYRESDSDVDDINS